MTEVKTYYYTDGNTVRQVEQPLPDRHTREREIVKKERKKEKTGKTQRHRQPCAANVSILCILYPWQLHWWVFL